MSKKKIVTTWPSTFAEAGSRKLLNRTTLRVITKNNISRLIIVNTNIIVRIIAGRTLVQKNEI